MLLALMGLAKTSFGPSFVGPRHPKPFSRCKKPASLQRSVSREEMLLSGEGAKVIEALPTVRQEDLPLNTSIALATIAMFGYMSYQFWTRIAFGKAFGSPAPEGTESSGSGCLTCPKELEIAQLRHCRSGGHPEAGGGV